MVKKCNLVVFNAEMVSIGAKKERVIAALNIGGGQSQSNSMKSQSVDLLVERLRRLGLCEKCKKIVIEY